MNYTYLRIIFCFRSPMTIGAAYAIDRRFFQEIGEFDEGMEFWGGDNFDLSLRVGFLLRFFFFKLLFV